MNAMMKIALATGADMPIPAADAPLLEAAFQEMGCGVEHPVWSDPAVDWAAYDAVLPSSTWDYHDHLDDFLAWADRVNGITRLFNTPKTLGWNSRKNYINRFAVAGVKVVPSLVIRPTSHYTLQRLRMFLGAERLVMKPVVGAGAQGIVVLDPEDEAGYQEVKAGGEYIAQPFLDSVHQGETSLTMIEGKLSHAVKKLPKSGDFRVQEEWGGSIEHHVPTEFEQEMGGILMWMLAEMPLYARVDMVEFEGRPALMELELIEPDLHLRHCAGSAEALARATLARIKA